MRPDCSAAWGSAVAIFGAPSDCLYPTWWNLKTRRTWPGLLPLSTLDCFTTIACSSWSRLRWTAYAFFSRQNRWFLSRPVRMRRSFARITRAYGLKNPAWSHSLRCYWCCTSVNFTSAWLSFYSWVLLAAIKRAARLIIFDASVIECLHSWEDSQ